MAERQLPRLIELYDDKRTIVPAKAVLLNPEMEKKTITFCYLWATPGEDSNPGSLSEALVDEDQRLFIWFTDIDVALDFYRGKGELDDALEKVIPLLDQSQSCWDFCAMDSGFESESEAVMARFTIRTSDE